MSLCINLNHTLAYAFLPLHVFCAAVDGYFEAFFMSLTPAAAGDRA